MGQCGCTPRSCADAGVECGLIDDGCGATASCGTCTPPTSCGGAGSPGRCGCSPRTCADALDAGVMCGTMDDGCGARIRCGGCPAGTACGAGFAPNICAAYRTCTLSWCPEYPWPTSWIRAIHGVNASDVWIVTGFSQGYRWDGTEWSRAGTTPPLNSIWAAGPEEAWGASDRVYRWNGATWDVLPHPPSPVLLGFSQVRGVSASDVWLTGSGNFVLRWQPQGWSTWRLGSPSPLSYVGAMWATAGDDVWVGMGGEQARRWNGSAWLSSPPAQFDDVWASASDDAWMVDSSGIHHWDGVSWTFTPRSSAAYSSVTGTGPSDVWFAGSQLTHFNGTTFIDLQIPPGTGHITAAWAPSPDAVLLGTNRGEVHLRHADGGYQTLAGGADARTLNDLWGNWAIGTGGLLLHWDGTDWRPQTVPTTADLMGIWGSGPDSIWVVGTGGVLHWDGSTWTAGPSAPVDAVWGSSATDVWAFGAPNFFHWDGTQWTSSPSPLSSTRRVRAAWGARANDIWAVGTAGTFVHWNGIAWSVEAASLTQENLIGVWGTGTAVEAISSGSVFRFDGQGWAPVQAPPSNELTSIWFDATGTRWLAGALDVYRGDPFVRLGAPFRLAKLRGSANEVRVLGNGIARYGP